MNVAAPIDVVIVGGGLAAARTAQALRTHGHDGSITMLTEEAVHPYDRPPLSKDMLLDRVATPTVLLSPEEAEANDIDVRLSHRVIGLDPARKTVAVQGDEILEYGSLVLATGTRARTLPRLDTIPGVHHLRTLDDSRAIQQQLKQGSRITIVGAGFIGLEVAASARSMGCEVMIVELAPKPLRGPLGDVVSTWLEQWHTARGVEFRCGVSVVSARATGSGVVTELSDGSQTEADLVVVGVGVARELDWMSSAGLRTHVGLVCDVTGRTSVADVYGAGDIACVHDSDDRCAPVQHWTAAADSAQRLARTMSGLPLEDDVAEDYFWSNQADLRIMSVGHAPPGVAPEITSGDLSDSKFVAVWKHGDQVAAVLGANSPREFFRDRLAYRSSVGRTTT